MKTIPCLFCIILMCVSCINQSDNALKRYIMETEKASIGYVQGDVQEKISALLQYVSYLDGELERTKVEGRLNLMISKATACERLARMYLMQGEVESATAMRMWINNNATALDRTPRDISILVDCLDEEMVKSGRNQY